MLCRGNRATTNVLEIHNLTALCNKNDNSLWFQHKVRAKRLLSSANRKGVSIPYLWRWCLLFKTTTKTPKLKWGNTSEALLLLFSSFGSVKQLFPYLVICLLCAETVGARLVTLFLSICIFFMGQTFLLTKHSHHNDLTSIAVTHSVLHALQLWSKLANKQFHLESKPILAHPSWGIAVCSSLAVWRGWWHWRCEDGRKYGCKQSSFRIDPGWQSTTHHLGTSTANLQHSTATSSQQVIPKSVLN